MWYELRVLCVTGLRGWYSGRWATARVKICDGVASSSDYGNVSGCRIQFFYSI